MIPTFEESTYHQKRWLQRCANSSTPENWLNSSVPFQLPATHRNREVSLELLREASQLGVNLYEEHQRFVKSFDPRWRTDEQVRVLRITLQ